MGWSKSLNIVDYLLQRTVRPVRNQFVAAKIEPQFSSRTTVQNGGTALWGSVCGDKAHHPIGAPSAFLGPVFLRHHLRLGQATRSRAAPDASGGTGAALVCANQFGTVSRAARGGGAGPVAAPTQPTRPKRRTVGAKPDAVVLPHHSVTALDGIGAQRVKALRALDLDTVRDVLEMYPRAYLDYGNVVRICDVQHGMASTITGLIVSSSIRSIPAKSPPLTILEVQVTDGSGTIKVTRFWRGAKTASTWHMNQQRSAYPQGARVSVSGTVRIVDSPQYGRQVSMDNATFTILDQSGAADGGPAGSGGAESTAGDILPVYRLTSKSATDESKYAKPIDMTLLRRIVRAALPAADHMEELLPPELRAQYGLMGIGTALRNIHFPRDEAAREEARRRLVFDELFFLQIGLVERKLSRQKQSAGRVKPITARGPLVSKFLAGLPFKLTGAQERAIGDVWADLEDGSKPMQRLVQGDVGSGKTVVAVAALLSAVQSGLQGALMAPTEVLALQHYETLSGWCTPLGVSVGILKGASSSTAKQRRQVLEELASGKLSLVVGTHALIEPSVEFAALGMVVIDEQHRFGVRQRELLQHKYRDDRVGHVLAITATPIPRTLALTLYGAMEVTTVDEMPPGRLPVLTTVLDPDHRDYAFAIIRSEVAQGNQAYVVVPVIEESDEMELRAAVAEHARLCAEVFPHLTVGLLHGRLPAREKDAVLSDFAHGHIHVLVCTTVVEVGVDVPNATVMVIENAERFGLATLHQLRGRVGRGKERSHCMLISGAQGSDSLQRLKVLEQSNDGFHIAEVDLQMRGAGELLGTKQSGLPRFALASLERDGQLLQCARDAAEALVLAHIEATEAGSLPSETFTKLSEEVQRRFNDLPDWSLSPYPTQLT